MRKRSSHFLAVAGAIAVLASSASASAADEPPALSARPVAPLREGALQRTAATLLDDHETTLFGREHTYNILPVLYPDFDTGLNLGFLATLAASDGRSAPYSLTAQIVASNKGNHKDWLLLRLPRSASFEWLVRAEFERDLRAHYYGLGNNSQREEALIDENSDRFIDDDFYTYNMKRPRLTVYGIRKFSPRVRFWFGLGYDFVRPQRKGAPQKSFLALDRPFGHLGGSGLHAAFRLVRDTRNNEFAPSRGSLSEISYEPSWASVRIRSEGVQTQGFSRGVIYHRITLANSQFMPLVRNRLILANRVAFETISGDAPYYVTSEFAGETLGGAIGGSQSLRGYKTRRFQDKVKMVTLTELRYNFSSFDFQSHTFNLGLAAFFDNGRVWHKTSEVALKDFYTSVGFGARMVWNEKMIVRFDLGHSSEGFAPYFRIYGAF